MKKFLFFAFFVFLFSSGVPSEAEVIQVPEDYPTIQGALDAAKNGDEVIVAEGVYYEHSLSFGGKKLTLRSTDPTDPRVVANTIVDARGLSIVFSFNSGEGRGSILAGLSITGGSTKDLVYGGGIRCKASSPTIKNCMIFGNHAGQGGGGLYIGPGSRPKVEECSIFWNTAGWGGGVLTQYAAPTVSGCEIRNNEAWAGGGIYVEGTDGKSAPSFDHCRVVQNRSTTSSGGGGIFCDGGESYFTNLLVVHNTSEVGEGGGVSFWNDRSVFVNCTIVENRGGGLYLNRSNPLLKNLIAWGEGDALVTVFDSAPGVTFSDIEGGWTGEGNVDADPQFASYHDYLLSPDSPCIDAGDPSLRDGGNWPEWYPNGSRSDMGAYGGPGNVGWLKK